MHKVFSTIVLMLSVTMISGQQFINNHLLPGVEAAEYVIEYYIPNKTNFTCPPKIAKPIADTLFTFLNLIIGDNNELEKDILQTMMGSNCRPYYTCRALNDLYLPIYLEALQNAGLSEMHSLLPVALSGSNPGFYNKPDKAGAWQLSFIVGRKFGLLIDDYFDERKDINLSTNAAINYLKFLNQQFNGNRLLVITAFYTSVPYVKNRIDLGGTFDAEIFYGSLDPDVRSFLVYLNTWDKWYRHFKSSNTQKYLRKANASLTEVISKDTLRFKWIANALSMDIEFIKSINPAYTAFVLLPGEQQVSFYLPEKKALLFNQKYDEIVKTQSSEEKTKQNELTKLEERMRKGIPDPKTHKAISYTVKSGDVLGLIAQRFSVRVSSIKQWNHLRSDRINIGKELVIYVYKSRKESEKKYPVITEQPKSSKQAAMPGNGDFELYTVKNGESLWLIARKFPGVSSENIMEWNGISDKISPGQKLKIYQAE
jgi:membrane-bound lytic murein transglycosylase D